MVRSGRTRRSLLRASERIIRWRRSATACTSVTTFTAKPLVGWTAGIGGSGRCRRQRRPLAGSLVEYARRWPDRREAMARAYRSGAYTMREIADHFGVHYMTVSRAVRRFEEELECET